MGNHLVRPQQEGETRGKAYKRSEISPIKRISGHRILKRKNETQFKKIDAITQGPQLPTTPTTNIQPTPRLRNLENARKKEAESNENVMLNGSQQRISKLRRQRYVIRTSKRSVLVYKNEKTGEMIRAIADTLSKSKKEDLICESAKPEEQRKERAKQSESAEKSQCPEPKLLPSPVMIETMNTAPVKHVEGIARNSDRIKNNVTLINSELKTKLEMLIATTTAELEIMKLMERSASKFKKHSKSAKN